MWITVYCGSRTGNNEIFIKAAKELGEWMGKNGHNLVFGASNSGLMGAVADAVLENGGQVVGVVPDVPEIKARMHKGLTDYVFTADMSERKKRMIEMADAYIALPGGIGTLDEITEVICLSQLRIHTKPCIFFNLRGYYEPVYQQFEIMEETGFAHAGGNGKVYFCAELDEIADVLSRER